VRLLLDTLASFLVTHRSSPTLGSGQRRCRESRKPGFCQRLQRLRNRLQAKAGRLPIFPESLLDGVRRERIGALPISVEHAVAAAALSGPHRDPWVRLMMARALSEHCHVVTVDRVFADYNVPVLW
jgi:hypothetical protein